MKRTALSLVAVLTLVAFIPQVATASPRVQKVTPAVIAACEHWYHVYGNPEMGILAHDMGIVTQDFQNGDDATMDAQELHDAAMRMLSTHCPTLRCESTGGSSCLTTRKGAFRKRMASRAFKCQQLVRGRWHASQDRRHLVR